MKALLYMVGAALALAVLASALQVALVLLGIILLVALLVDPVRTITRLGALTVFLLFLSGPVPALLVLITVFLAAIVTHVLKGGRDEGGP